MGLLGQPGDQDLVCHLILVQSSFGIYESSSQNAQEGHKFRAAFAVHHSSRSHSGENLNHPISNFLTSDRVLKGLVTSYFLEIGRAHV